MPRFDRLSRAACLVAWAAGIVASVLAGTTGWSLADPDAKAHLVVARRILDSRTPGWTQIGAVWLPLPHLLNMLPVQVDAFYRTGASAVAISVAALGLSAACVSAIVRRLTGSAIGALTAVALYVLNPNVLYLHVTPLTEPLLYAALLMALWGLTAWASSDDPAPPRAVAWWMAAACLTRYEAWAVTPAAVLVALGARWRRGMAAPDLARAGWRLARAPSLAVLAFLCLSRATVGQWLATGGFFVPDPRLHGQPLVAWHWMLDAATTLAGPWLLGVGAVAAAGVAFVAIGTARRTSLLVPLSLGAAVLLPYLAYVEGHPFRARYEISVLPVLVLAVGIAVGLAGRCALVLGPAVLLAALAGAPPLRAAPLLREALQDRIHRAERRAVTACLAHAYRGEPVMVSMASLAHYVQELSRIGLDVADFLHEGNQPEWDAALAGGAASHAGWLLVEEGGPDGGDVLARRLRSSPAFGTGLVRACRGGIVSLYQRRGIGPGPADTPVLHPRGGRTATVRRGHHEHPDLPDRCLEWGRLRCREWPTTSSRLLRWSLAPIPREPPNERRTRPERARRQHPPGSDCLRFGADDELAHRASTRSISQRSAVLRSLKVHLRAPSLGVRLPTFGT
ncbi:MAG: hypothetical protein AB7O28_21895 [Vicinamibacterales bacterium]